MNDALTFEQIKSLITYMGMVSVGVLTWGFILDVAKNRLKK